MESKKWSVLVNGMGNIGTTLANLLVTYKSILEIAEIYVTKRTLTPWNKAERDLLEQQGIIICGFDTSNDMPQYKDVVQQVDYIFEATANGVGLNNKAIYQRLANLKGVSAQGSEKGFGLPFMTGVNNTEVVGAKFVNVVSCNTHGSAALLQTFAGSKLANLKSADMVVVRRSEDLGNHERLVSSNVVARHLDGVTGTHHAIDVKDMFATINVACPITSSDITTPSQLMHSVRFNIELKKPLVKSPAQLISESKYIASSLKFDSNVIFELGRRYGFHGRIFSHAIVLNENILVSETHLKGWAFIPQEGNSLLSTIHAYLLQLKFKNEAAIMAKLTTDLLEKKW